jgi:hypothetical protein
MIFQTQMSQRKNKLRTHLEISHSSLEPNNPMKILARRSPAQLKTLAKM